MPTDLVWRKIEIPVCLEELTRRPMVPSSAQEGVGPRAGWLDRISWIAAILGILVLTVSSPFLYNAISWRVTNPDPFTYAQDAKEVLQGRKLYTDIYFDKGPLTVALLAIPELISPNSYPAICVFLGVLLAVEALVFAWFFRDEPIIGFVCASVFVIVPLTNPDLSWPGTEHLANLFVVPALGLAFYIAKSRRFSVWQCMAIGLLLCFATKVRQPSLLSVLVPLAAILYTANPIRKKLIGVLYVGIGGVIGFGIVLIWMAFISDIPSYIQMAFVHSATYAGLGSWGDSISLVGDGLKTPLGILTLLAFAGAMFSRYRLLACAAMASALAAMILPHRNSLHYWVGMFPSLALLVAIALDRLKELNKHLCWLPVLFIYTLCGAPVDWTLTDVPGVPHWADYQKLAESAEQDSHGHGSLLVFGDVNSEAIQFASHLRAANKYWILWMLEPPSDTLLPVGVDQIIADYVRHPPDVIVAENSLLNRLQQPTEVQAGYTVRTKLGHALFSRYPYVLRDKAHYFSIETYPQPRNSGGRHQSSDGE